MTEPLNGHSRQTNGTHTQNDYNEKRLKTLKEWEAEKQKSKNFYDDGTQSFFW